MGLSARLSQVPEVSWLQVRPPRAQTQEAKVRITDKMRLDFFFKDTSIKCDKRDGRIWHTVRTKQTPRQAIDLAIGIARRKAAMKAGRRA